MNNIEDKQKYPKFEFPQYYWYFSYAYFALLYLVQVNDRIALSWWCYYNNKTRRSVRESFCSHYQPALQWLVTETSIFMLARFRFELHAWVRHHLLIFWQCYRLSTLKYGTDCSMLDTNSIGCGLLRWSRTPADDLFDAIRYWPRLIELRSARKIDDPLEYWI